MNKLYNIAGVELEVRASEDIIYSDEKKLSEFRVEDVLNPHIYTFDVVEMLDEPEGALVAQYPNYCVYNLGDIYQRYIGTCGAGWENANIRVTHNKRNHSVQVKKSEYFDRITAKTLLNSMAAENMVLEANGVVIHGSFIEHKGKAILFTAPSGTGKSTQAELWKKHRNAKIINGDRAVVRLVGDKAFACGIPFAGSSKYCENAMLSIEAIVCLKQSPLTTIKRLDSLSSFRQIWEECTINTWNSVDVEKAINILIDIIGQIPVFELACTPDESAIIALENELNLI